MRSRSSPPFFTSASWQLTQYWFTTDFTGAAKGEEDGCPAMELKTSANSTTEQQKRIPR